MCCAPSQGREVELSHPAGKAEPSRARQINCHKFLDDPTEIPASEIPVRFPAWRGRRRRIQAESGRAGTSGGVPAGKRDVSRVCPGAVRSGVQARPGAPPRGGDRPDGPATVRATAACLWVRAAWRVRQSGIGKSGKHERVLSRRHFSRPLASSAAANTLQEAAPVRAVRKASIIVMAGTVVRRRFPCPKLCSKR